jgi:cytochrome b561
MSQVTRYHPFLVALHWLLALMIPTALTLGALVLVKLPNSDPMKIQGLRQHMIAGGVILTLMLVRLLVRTRTAHPAPAPSGNALLNKLAWASHRLFYPLVFMMVGSGVIMALQANLPAIVFGGHGSLPRDFWVFTPRVIHYVISRILMTMIALHVAGALYHMFFLKDRLLGRMGFGKRMPAATISKSPILDRPLSKDYS